MTWTAPDVLRVEPPDIADERTSLDSWLDYHRATLLWKCRGLTAEQLMLRPVSTSSLSLLGLVRHMTDVERIWFRLRVAGEDLSARYSTYDNPDGEFDDATADRAEADFAAYGEEVELCRSVARGRSLDDTFSHRDRVIDVRWVYVHMIEEYARHNGHADLVRELVDGSTGD